MGQARFKKKIVAGVVLIGMFASLCYAQDAQDPVRNRLKEMQGEDVQAAQVAELELLSMGEKATDRIKEIIDGGENDPQREEALKVYPKLLEKAGQLTRVSLDFDNASHREVIESLNKQCKTREINLRNSEINSRLTIHQDKVPYALALAEICRGVDGTAGDLSNGKVEIWRNVGSKNRPICERWGNVTILDNITLESRMDFESKERSPLAMHLYFDLIMDPSLQTLCGGGFKDVVAVDESGKAFGCSPNSDVQVNGEMGGMTRRHYMRCAAPAESKKIARLSGKIREIIGQGMETWMIDDASKAGGTSHDFGAIEMNLKTATLSDREFKVSLSLMGIPSVDDVDDNIAQTPYMPQATHMIDSLLRGALKVESVDPRRRWTCYSSSYGKIKWNPQTRSIGCDATLVYTNRDGAPGEVPRIQVVLPKTIREIWVDFEFKDIELP